MTSGTDNRDRMIDQEDKIEINADHRTVFAYISDLRNDKLWRMGVNSTTLEGTLGEGAIAVESSFLSRRVPAYVARLLCTEYLQDVKVTFETFPDNRNYLRSTRSVSKIAENRTEVTYRLEFSPSLAAHGLGFSIPGFIISMVTKRAMKKYLRLLKNNLESQTHVVTVK